jgi:hypothetical protein
MVFDVVRCSPQGKAGMLASLARREYLAHNACYLMLFHVFWIVDNIVDA